MTNRQIVGIAVVVGVFVGIFAYILGMPRNNVSASAAVQQLSDAKEGVSYKARTELCVENGVTMRNWIFNDRWMKNQLSHDTFVVDGRTYKVFEVVTDDKTLPKQNVRFRKEKVNVGSGPTLEGHWYMRTLINGNEARMERELLFVEFNGRLESQRRPLPSCGTPRS